MNLTGKEKISYGIGAFGKDLVYMLVSAFLLIYYNTVLGMDSVYIGFVLMAARIFDAFNDPLMGVIIAKTNTKWGKFRPWILSGTILNAVVLYALFSVPQGMEMGAMKVWLFVVYLLWGITYTVMDIPYWSMIPAITSVGKERENVSAMARSAAGIGSAIPTVLTMVVVPVLGGGCQILAMMLFPLFRKKFDKIKLFHVSTILGITGYITILCFAFTGITRITETNKFGWMLCFIPGMLIFMGSGLLNVLITVFLSDSIDYGEYKTGRRDESVICSMQTFVVKLASGVSALLAGVAIKVVGLNVTGGATVADQSFAALTGLRISMTILPTIGLICAMFYFKKKYKLDDETLQEIVGK